MSAGVGSRSGSAYRHEAFFYRGDAEFVAGCVDFVEEGLRAGEHAVVAVVPDKARMLQATLGERAAQVTFLDMAECGRNPARIIQVWRDLVEAAELRGAGVRGIGEPIWTGRTGEEIREAELHEALLNDAFDERHRLLLRCPYDRSGLGPDVLATARTTHPVVVEDPEPAPSGDFAPGAVVDAAFLDRLEEPDYVEEELRYGPYDLIPLRGRVADAARRHGLGREDTEALVLSVREIAVNSIRHGGGSGRLRVWADGGTLVCEVSDAGHIAHSMVGRLRPSPESENGRGVWLANQLCDLVQIRSSPHGTVVRLHLALPPDRRVG